MAVISDGQFARRKAWRRARGVAFHGLCLLAVLVGLVMLGALLFQIVAEGWSRVSWDFLNSFPSRNPDLAGIKAAVLGSLYVVAVAGLVSFTLGVAAAIYLEEYAPKNWIAGAIQTNIANLAGVPSIVYGILGLEIFVRSLTLGKSVLAGGFTLALLILPIVIVAAEQAIRAVPSSLREGSYALGATRWQTIRGLVLPQAFPGILTGSILAVSRAVGETAPLIIMGALTFVPFAPNSPMDRFTVLPIQVFNWTSRPNEEFQRNAAAGIIVLLVLLLALNAGAVLLRNKLQSRLEG